MFFLFDLVSSFHQITAHMDTVPLTTLCTPTSLYEWLVLPQGSSASPEWFVKVINEVIKDLKQVAAYLDDVIVFDPGPVAHVRTIRSSLGAFGSTISIFAIRRSDWVPPMRTFWATLHFPSRPTLKRRKRVCVDQYADAHRR